MAHQQMPIPSSIRRCSADGVPALFPCNPSREGGRLFFVCAADLSLGCEQFNGQFFCCASEMEKSLVEMLQRVVRVEERRRMRRTQKAPPANSTTNAPPNATANVKTTNATTMALDGTMAKPTTLAFVGANVRPKSLAIGNATTARPTAKSLSPKSVTIVSSVQSFPTEQQRSSVVAPKSFTSPPSVSSPTLKLPLAFPSASPAPSVVMSSKTVKMHSQLLFPILGDGDNGTDTGGEKAFGDRTAKASERKKETNLVTNDGHNNCTLLEDSAKDNATLEDSAKSNGTTENTKRSGILTDRIKDNGTLTHQTNVTLTNDTKDNCTLTNCTGGILTNETLAFANRKDIATENRSTTIKLPSQMMAKNNNTTAKRTTVTISKGSRSNSLGISSSTPKEFAASASCIDLVPQCWWSAKLCNNARYSRLVRLQCPKMCNICSVHGMDNDVSNSSGKMQCLDKGKDCPRVAFLCRTNAYGALMASECAKTCGHCDNGGGTNGTSEDEGEKNGERKKQKEDKRCEAKDNYARCALWRLQGFCTSSKYSKYLKSRYCAKTCAICERTKEAAESEPGN